MRVGPRTSSEVARQAAAAARVPTHRVTNRVAQDHASGKSSGSVALVGKADENKTLPPYYRDNHAVRGSSPSRIRREADHGGGRYCRGSHALTCRVRP